MLDSAHVKTLPLLNQATNLAPAAQACCGACRTCMTTNAVTLAMAGLAAAGAYATRLVRQIKPG